MSKLALLAGLVVVGGGVAQAGPAARFGMTFALTDPGSAGAYEIGPLIGVGERLGPFVGELDYAYLSFFDSSASPGGVHRVDATLRADLMRTHPASYRYGTSHAIYGELGAGERFGHWIVDAQHVIPANTPQPEAHIGLGFQLDEARSNGHNGWQLGLRFAISPSDAGAGTACRGTGCAATTMPAASSGGVDRAVFVEWMFLLGS